MQPRYIGKLTKLLYFTVTLELLSAQSPFERRGQESISACVHDDSKC